MRVQSRKRPTYSLAPSLGPPCSPSHLIAGLGSAPITDCVLWSPSWSRCPLAWGSGQKPWAVFQHVIKGHWASRAPSLAGILVPCCEPLGRDGPHPGVRAGGKRPRLRGAQGYGPAAPRMRQVNGLRRGNPRLADDGGQASLHVLHISKKKKKRALSQGPAFLPEAGDTSHRGTAVGQAPARSPHTPRVCLQKDVREHSQVPGVGRAPWSVVRPEPSLGTWSPAVHTALGICPDQTSETEARNSFY